MSGPPRKPTALRILQGNPSKRPLPEGEPHPEIVAPSCPAWMRDKIAIAAWRELASVLEGMRVVSEADRKALELLCDAYAEWRRAREVVIEHGTTYEAENVNGGLMLKVRPEVALAADAWRRIRSMLTEFGLTPAARARVKVGEIPEEDPLEAYLKRRP